MAEFGRVDILVNNAGIRRDTPFDAMTLELLDPMFAVHLPLACSAPKGKNNYVGLPPVRIVH